MLVEEKKIDKVVEHHAKVISFVNMKGGVGKTTLTKEIGYRLSKSLKKNVLLIDVDPQMNLTQSMFQVYGYAPSQEIAKQIRLEDKDSQDSNDKSHKNIKISHASIAEIFQSSISSSPNMQKAVQQLEPDNLLDIVPGELGIEFLTRNLNSNTLENGIYEFIKRNHLRSIYDFILIDCPPTYSSYTVAALKPSDFYIIPVKPEAYSVLGVNMLLKVVDSVVSSNEIYYEKSPLKSLGIVFTDVLANPSSAISDIMKNIETSEELSKSGTYIFDTTFLHNATLKRKITYLIDNSNSEERSKPNLANLVDEMLNRIEELDNDK